MPTEIKKEIRLEIAHVLFIDIVGYTKLLINEQLEHLEKLREIARGTETFRAAQREGKLMRLPTGDGGALVFRTNPEAAVNCAIEIARELKKHPAMRVRMGIHSGPVKEVTDLSEQGNIAGAGVNIAQRVMDCADAGHIFRSTCSISTPTSLEIQNARSGPHAVRKANARSTSSLRRFRKNQSRCCRLKI